MAKATRTGDGDPQGMDLNNLEAALRLQQQINEESKDYVDLVEKTESKLKKLSSEYDVLSSKLKVLSNGQIDIEEVQNRVYREQIKNYQNVLFSSRRAIDNEKLIVEEKLNSLGLSKKIQELEQVRVSDVHASNQKLLDIEQKLTATQRDREIKQRQFNNAKGKTRVLIEKELQLQAQNENMLMYQRDLVRQSQMDGQNSLQKELEGLQRKKSLHDQVVKNLQAQIRYDKASISESEKKIQAEEAGLRIEQEVSKQMGVSSMIAQALANKLGVGREFQESMTLSARKLVESRKNLLSLEEELNENKKSQADVEKKLAEAGDSEKKEYEIQLASLKKQNDAIQQSIEYNKQSASSTSMISDAFGRVKNNAYSSYKGMSLGVKALGVFGLLVSGVTKAFDAMGSGVAYVGKTISGLSEDSSNFFGNMMAPINGMIAKIPIVGGLLSGLVTFTTSLLDLMIGVDDHIVKLGRQIGLSATSARKLRDEFSGIARSSEKTYVTAKALAESFAELAKSTGLNNLRSREVLETNIELSKYAGIEASTRAQIADVAQITGTTMKGVTKDVLAQVVALQKTTGIAFNYQQILAEAATLSGRLGLAFAKYPKELAKSLVATKAMGLDLKELNSMASSFLEFESSLSKEFEAQLLTGKEINLAKARELFMTNDLAGAAEEITKQVGDTNSFLKMNRFQQDALAESMGMTADQMADMLKKQELFAKFSAKDQKDLLNKISLMRSQNKEAEIRAKFQSEEAYQSMINLSTQEKLMTAFDKIKQSLVEFLTRENVLNKIQSLVDWLSSPKNIQSIVDTVREYIAKVVNFVGGSIALILETVGNIAGMWPFGEKGDILERQLDEYADKARDFSSTIVENLRKVQESSTPKIEKQSVVEPVEEERIERAVTRKKVEDAVIFPKSNLVVDKDPLDYTIFTKNPSALQPPVDRLNKVEVPKSITLKLDELQPYVQQIVSAIKEQNKDIRISVNADELRSTFERAVSQMKQYANAPVNVQLTGLDSALQQMVSAIKEVNARSGAIRVEDISSDLREVASTINRKSSQPVIIESSNIEELVKRVQVSVESQKERIVSVDTSRIEAIVQDLVDKKTTPIELTGLESVVQRLVDQKTSSVDLASVESIMQKLVDQNNKLNEPTIVFEFKDVSAAIDRVVLAVNDIKNTVGAFVSEPKYVESADLSAKTNREVELPAQYIPVGAEKQPSISDIMDTVAKSITVYAQVKSEDVKKIVSEVVNGMPKDKPMVIHTHANLSIDGQVAAMSTVRSIKNNPMLGFDRQSGPMSLNT